MAWNTDDASQWFEDKYSRRDNAIAKVALLWRNRYEMNASLDGDKLILSFPMAGVFTFTLTNGHCEIDTVVKKLNQYARPPFESEGQREWNGKGVLNIIAYGPEIQFYFDHDTEEQTKVSLHPVESNYVVGRIPKKESRGWLEKKISDLRSILRTD